MRVGGGCLRDSIRRKPLRACANHLLGLHLLVELYFRNERALRLRAPHSRSPETSMVPNESRSILVVAIALCATITSSRPLPRPGCCHRLFRSAVRPSLPALSTSLPACSAGPSGFWQPGTKLRSIAAATALNANLVERCCSSRTTNGNCSAVTCSLKVCRHTATINPRGSLQQ